MLFHISHKTIYSYASKASYSANQLMLFPLKDEWQRIVSHQLLITNDPVVEIHTDYFGNQKGTFTIIEPHNELVIHSMLSIETLHKPVLAISHTPLQAWTELNGLASSIPFSDFLKSTSFSVRPELLKTIALWDISNNHPYEIANKICRYIFQECAYIKGATTIETTIDEIWQHKKGVCQDFAHLMLAFLRLANIPARYVSGYICPNNDGMRGAGATHAWVEAYIPFYGWLGFDPTNNCIVNEKHVKLAVGRNFADCSPVKGTYRGTKEHELTVEVEVEYSDEQVAFSVNQHKEKYSIKPINETSQWQQNQQ
jgi:transglutaminase-like putative cysteine protease